MPKDFGFGAFRDEYDNRFTKSLDHHLNPGGVTDLDRPLEEDMDLLTENFNPQHGEKSVDAPSLRTPSENDLRQGFSHRDWRGPRDYKRSDARILDDVCLALERSQEVDASQLEVDVEEGCVTMRGVLPTKGMKIVAQDLVYSVPGVEDVFTQIRIERP